MAADGFEDIGPSKNAAPGDGDAWGLASLGLGGVAMLAAPITLVSNVLLWQSDRLGSLSRVPALLAAGVGVLVMLGLSSCSIAFGIRGHRIGRDHRRPPPLAMAGVLLGSAATIGWLIVGIDLFAILLPL